MPAYKETRTLKDGKTVTSWVCRFYCNGRQRKKRGFKTKKEAIEYEVNYLNQNEGSPNMLMKDFVNIYYEDRKFDWKETTKLSVQLNINKWVLPYFGDKSLNSITYQEIKKWHSTLRENLKDTTSRKVNTILSGMFNHAVKFYGLKENPCHKAGSIGSFKRKEITFWTLEEYKEFISHVDKPQYKVAFDTLYQTGMRISELKALTLQDIDFSVPKIMVRKNFYKEKGKVYITTPKTESSVRDITISNSLANEILELTSHYYNFKDTDFIFKNSKQAYLNEIKRVCKKFGLKPIRLHDFRHSHASFLINSGYDALMVAERLGHASPKMTLDIYAHLFPSRQLELIDKFEEIF